MDPAPKREVLISARTVAKVFLVVLALSAVCCFIVLARQALGLVVISIFLALALGPAVDFFHNRSRIPRWLSILIVYFFLLAAIVLIGLVVVPPIVSGVQAIANDIPQRVEELKNTGWILDRNERYDQTRPASPRLQSWVKGRPVHSTGSVRRRTYVRGGSRENQAGPSLESNTAAGLAVDGRGGIVRPTAASAVAGSPNEASTALSRGNPATSVVGGGQVVDNLVASVRELPKQLGTAAGTLQAVTLGALSAFVQLITVLAMAFLWLLDGPRLARWISAQFYDEAREWVERFAETSTA